MANGTKELNTSPITIEDEINEFSEKPVQGKTLYKKLKELEDGSLPDTSEASVGDALVLDEDKNPVWAAGGGGGGGRTIALKDIPVKTATDGEHVYSSDSTVFEVVVNGETRTISNPTFWVPYAPSVGDKLVYDEEGMTVEALALSVMIEVADEVTKTRGSNSKSGDIKGAGSPWHLTKGTIYTVGTVDGEGTFVSSDSVLEYIE